MVRKGGLEPPRLAAPDPKSGASANSATFAYLNQLLASSLDRLRDWVRVTLRGGHRSMSRDCLYCKRISTGSAKVYSRAVKRILRDPAEVKKPKLKIN